MKKIGYISVCPVQYDMTNKKVRICTELSYDVKFASSPNPSPQKIIGDGEDAGVLPFDFSYPGGWDEGFYGGGGGLHEVNHPTKLNTILTFDYLIISTPEYKEAIDKLVDWKTRMGYTMHAIYNDTWTIEGIKDTVYNFASTHSSFTHLLLFGSHPKIPAQYYYTTFGPVYTDLFYACLNGKDDYYPDVLYGRIPAENIDEANTIVDKIIAYEKNPHSNSQAWNTANFVGSFYTDYGFNCESSDRNYVYTCESIRNRLRDLKYNTNYFYATSSNSINPLYWSNGTEIPSELRKPNYSWNKNANDLNNAIGNGCFSVLYRGHGKPWYWELPYYTTDNVNFLNNGNLTPVIFSITCHTGALHIGSQSLAAAFLKHPYGGSSAVIAASNASLTDHNNYFAKGIYETILPSANIEYPFYEIGKIKQKGLAKASKFITNKLYNNYQRIIYHCFGDPSMRMYTQTPKTLSELTDVTIIREVSKITVTTEKNMYISVYDPTTKTSELIYGTKYQKMFAQDIFAGIVDKTKDLIVYVYNDNYKPGVFQNRTIIALGTLSSCNINNNTLDLTYEIPDSEGVAIATVTDVYGNTKLTIQCNGEQTEATIDVSSLQSGVYIVSLIYNGAVIGTQRIIK